MIALSKIAAIPSISRPRMIAPKARNSRFGVFAAGQQLRTSSRSRSRNMIWRALERPSIGLQFGERARHGFQGEPQIVGDVATTHWQRDHAGPGEAAIHFEQKGGHALCRRFATQEKHKVFGVSEFA